MLSTLATLMILTFAAFAVIAMFGTVANHRKLIVSALRYLPDGLPHARAGVRSGGRRTIKVSMRTTGPAMSVAA